MCTGCCQHARLHASLPRRRPPPVARPSSGGRRTAPAASRCRTSSSPPTTWVGMRGWTGREGCGKRARWPRRRPAAPRFERAECSPRRRRAPASANARRACRARARRSLQDRRARLHAQHRGRGAHERQAAGGFQRGAGLRDLRLLRAVRLHERGCRPGRAERGGGGRAPGRGTGREEPARVPLGADRGTDGAGRRLPCGRLAASCRQLSDAAPGAGPAPPRSA